MVLSEFDDDWVLDSVDYVFGVVAGVYLTKGSLRKLAHDLESPVKD